MGRKSSDTLTWLVQRHNGITESTQSRNTAYRCLRCPRGSQLLRSRRGYFFNNVSSGRLQCAAVEPSCRCLECDKVLGQVHGRTYLSAFDCALFLAPCQLHVVSSVQRWQLARLNDAFESRMCDATTCHQCHNNASLPAGLSFMSSSSIFSARSKNPCSPSALPRRNMAL